MRCITHDPLKCQFHSRRSSQIQFKSQNSSNPGAVVAGTCQASGWSTHTLLCPVSSKSSQSGSSTGDAKTLRTQASGVPIWDSAYALVLRNPLTYIPTVYVELLKLRNILHHVKSKLQNKSNFTNVLYKTVHIRLIGCRDRVNNSCVPTLPKCFSREEEVVK